MFIGLFHGWLTTLLRKVVFITIRALTASLPQPRPPLQAAAETEPPATVRVRVRVRLGLRVWIRVRVGVRLGLRVWIRVGVTWSWCVFGVGLGLG